MTSVRVARRLRTLTLVACSVLAGPAAAIELVVNGNFESNGGAGSGTFAGWQTFATGVQGGFKAQTGTTAPLTPFAVPAPSGGSFSAMTDQNGPGGYALYQDVAIPAGAAATLTARIFVLNQADEYSTPANLDYQSIPNQQARFDVVTTAAPVLDVGAGVLQNVFRTQAGDAPMQGYATVMADLSAYAGQTVRLRFASTDNRQGLNFGVDLVSVSVPGCVLDVDGNGSTDALTDGLLIIRAMFGLTGTSVTSGAVAPGAPLETWAAIQPMIRFYAMDVDGNGVTDARTDGLMLLRAMFGLTGAAVTSNATGAGAPRADWNAVRGFLNSQCGASFPP